MKAEGSAFTLVEGAFGGYTFNNLQIYIEFQLEGLCVSMILT